MITNFKNTTVSEELGIMIMPDVEEKDPWLEEYERENEVRNVREYGERLEMESKGYVLNPEYDEDRAYRAWKYDEKPDFACKPYVTPEELAEFRRMNEVIGLGWILYGRLVIDEDLDRQAA